MACLLVLDSNPTFSDELTTLVKRFNDRVEWLASDHDAAIRVLSGGVHVVLIRLHDQERFEIRYEQTVRAAKNSQVPSVVLTQPLPITQLTDHRRQGVTYHVIEPFHPRELLSCVYALIRRQRRVVCLGGGTGLYTLLLGLKLLPNIHLTSVVNMSDDGGSTGRIREAFGILPPGDIRRSLVALSAAPQLMKDLIQYRFAGGEGLKDHNLGNLLLTAMTDLTGSMAEAVRTMGDILNIQGVVLPVTTTNATLVAECADGTVVRGERAIDVPVNRDPHLRIARLWQEPPAEANPNALSALLAADVITIGPGDLFTSVVATLTVQGIAEAIRRSGARAIYICNLMTKPGETSGFTAEDHLREILRYIGEDVLDDVLVSNTTLSAATLHQYTLKDQEPVRLEVPQALQRLTKARLIEADLGSEQDLVRHHHAKLAAAIAQLFDGASSDRRV